MPAIRHATDEDGPAVAAVMAAVFAEYESCPFVLSEFPELAAPASHHRNRGGNLWVVEEDGEVAGSIGLSRIDDTDQFQLHKLYLARRLRGTGTALGLYGLAEAEALSRGARGLRLWTDTRFVAGHRFYEKLGFRRVPVVRYLADVSRSWEYAYVREFGP